MYYMDYVASTMVLVHETVYNIYTKMKDFQSIFYRFQSHPF